MGIDEEQILTLKHSIVFIFIDNELQHNLPYNPNSNPNPNKTH